MTDNNIGVNLTNPSEHEFSVVVSNTSGVAIPIVRFVIETSDCDYSFRCQKVEGEKSKWLAKMPALTHIQTSSAHFRVEVIVDDYYFEPAQGEITFITSPEVNFRDKTTVKPSVTTSFTVKQDDEEKEGKHTKGKKKEDTPLTETPQGGGGGEITGRYAPNNSLLVPEEDPTENGRMHGDTSVNDEFTDKDRLSLDKAEDIGSSITPGDARAYQQEDGKPRAGKIIPGNEPSEEEEFDPKKVADSIMKDMVGKVAKPNTRGTLFKRDSAGKPVVKGLERAETIQTQNSNAKKVRDILNSK